MNEAEQVQVMKTYKFLPILWLCSFVMLASAAENRSGAFLGSRTSEKPSWFKESFLEFEEDVAEAAKQNKRVMLFFHQDGCPYCARLVEENFKDPELKSYIQKHFDGISLNMWGDREVVSVSGKSFTEKTLAAALKVQFTPTLLFLNEQGKVILRLNGYQAPGKLRKALTYVAQKQENKSGFTQFMLIEETSSDQQLTGDDFFLKVSDLHSLVNRSDKPLAIYFEAGGCDDCRVLHDKVLKDTPTRALVHDMDNVLLDVNSDADIVTPDGQVMSQRKFAEKLKIIYTPSIVLLDDQGGEVHRLEGFFKTFHVQSSLAYVLDGGYKRQPSFQRYISERAEKIRELGYDVDIWGYKSFHPAGIQITE
jgi:thioredoxin-related protein